MGKEKVWNSEAIEKIRGKRPGYKGIFLASLLGASGQVMVPKTAVATHWETDSVGALNSDDWSDLHSKEDERDELKENEIGVEKVDKATAERLIQEEYYKLLDSVRFLADSQLNALMIESQLASTLTDLSEHDQVIPENVQSDDDIDYPDGEIPDIMGFELELYLTESGPTSEESKKTENDKNILQTITNRADLYDRWLRDKLRYFYRRYENVKRIGYATLLGLREEIGELYEEIGARRETEGFATVEARLLEYILNTKSGDPRFMFKTNVFSNSPNTESKMYYEYVGMMMVDSTNHVRCVFMPDFVPSVAETISGSGLKYHSEGGLAVVELGVVADLDKFGETEAYDMFKTRLSANDFALPDIISVDWPELKKELIAPYPIPTFF